ELTKYHQLHSLGVMGVVVSELGREQRGTPFWRGAAPAGKNVGASAVGMRGSRAPCKGQPHCQRDQTKKVPAGYTAAEGGGAALLASTIGNTVTASGPRPRLRSSGNSAHC